MKLRAITLRNVRRFAGTARIEGIGDGLNLLCERNEQGKSTLFDAVQALFFKPHGSRDRDAMALRPHVGGAPEVAIEIETDEGRFVLAKRWLSKPFATVSQGERLVAQADAAEAWIARQLGGNDGGPAGLVWVRQGMTGLAGGSRKEQDAALEMRRDLMSSVGHEVEAMTGGRMMDEALARCRAELADYATGTGRPRTGGRWKAALDEVEALGARRDDLSATAHALHEALDARRRCRAELSELEAADAVAARKSRLEDAVAALHSARRHAEAVESAARKVETARLALNNATARREALRTALAERAAAMAEAEEAAAGSRKARGLRDEAAAALGAARAALSEAQADRQAAEAALRAARRAQAARDGAARREELADRIAQSEAARTAMEHAAASGRTGPDAKSLRRIEALNSALVAALAARDGSAAHIVMTYLDGRDGAVRLDGAPLAHGQPVAIPRHATLTIDGVGDLALRPGAAQQDDAAVETARQALQSALDDAGVPDLEAARAAAEARAVAEAHCREAKTVLDTLAPDGIDPLRAALAAIPEPVADDEAVALPDAEAALATAETVQIDAQSRHDAAVERHADARATAARAEAAATGAADRLHRAEDALTRLGNDTDADLTAVFDAAVKALEAAESAHAEMARAAPDLPAAEAAVQRARSVDEEARAAIARLRPEIATLDERISRGAGDAVEERLAETEQALAAAKADLARIEHEIAVLRRLEAALDAAKTQARERYFAPVAAELKPLLHLLWPEADLAWGQETLLPTALIRDGAEEPIEILSGGTQEQVALLVRLAFARMLARTGRHAPVILDDALVFTDDDRIERMFDALHRQAGDLQILVLSCRQRAFRDLGGRLLRIAHTGTVERTG